MSTDSCYLLNSNFERMSLLDNHKPYNEDFMKSRKSKNPPSIDLERIMFGPFYRALMDYEPTLMARNKKRRIKGDKILSSAAEIGPTLMARNKKRRIMGDKSLSSSAEIGPCQPTQTSIAFSFSNLCQAQGPEVSTGGFGSTPSLFGQNTAREQSAAQNRKASVQPASSATISLPTVTLAGSAPSIQHGTSHMLPTAHQQPQTSCTSFINLAQTQPPAVTVKPAPATTNPGTRPTMPKVIITRTGPSIQNGISNIPPRPTQTCNLGETQGPAVSSVGFGNTIGLFGQSTFGQRSATQNCMVAPDAKRKCHSKKEKLLWISRALHIFISVCRMYVEALEDQIKQKIEGGEKEERRKRKAKT